jgi:hypothetical protein
MELASVSQSSISSASKTSGIYEQIKILKEGDFDQNKTPEIKMLKKGLISYYIILVTTTVAILIFNIICKNIFEIRLLESEESFIITAYSSVIRSKVQWLFT